MLLAAAKSGVLAARAGAAILGLVLGRLRLAPAATSGAADTADWAESSTESENGERVRHRREAGGQLHNMRPAAVRDGPAAKRWRCLRPIASS